MTRVEAWDGEGTIYLGRGTLIKSVTFRDSYREKHPDKTDEELFTLFVTRSTVGVMMCAIYGEEVARRRFTEKTTPTILLDTGETVHGFYIWWRPVEEGEDEGS